MPAERVDIRLVYRGTDQVIQFERRTLGSVAGWTTALFIRKTSTSADPPHTFLGTIADVGSPTTKAVFEVLMPQAQLLAFLEVRAYLYSFKRTNPGASTVLAKGRLYAESDVEHALLAPAPAAPPAIFQLIEVLGGSLTGYQFFGLPDYEYLPYVDPTSLIIDTYTINLNAQQLYSGFYVFEATAKTLAPYGDAKVGLFSLPDDILLAEVEFTAAETQVGVRKRSSPFVIPSVDTEMGVKGAVRGELVGMTAIGCKVLRISGT